MSLDYFNEGHEMFMCCDFCEEESQFYGEWNECIREAKEEGWKIFKADEEWVHKCPVCANKKVDPRGVFNDS